MQNEVYLYIYLRQKSGEFTMNIELKILNKEFYKGYYTGDYISGARGVSSNECNLPMYATPGSAGMDLICCEDIAIYSGEVKAIHTGIAIWIGSRHETPTHGYTALILPRSGLGTKGLILANTAGVIDEDYQGELIVQAWNRCPCVVDRRDVDAGHAIPVPGNSRIILNAGDKFAQLVFVPIIKAQFNVVEEFSHATNRGAGGFGSTGQ